MPTIYRTAISRQDYLDIWQYIANDNIEAASHLLRDFDRHLEMMLQHPFMGKPRGRLSRNLRSFSVGEYVIFYRPVQDGIQLIRVLHGKRKQTRKMFRT